MSWISKLLAARPIEMPPGTLALNGDPMAPLPAAELRAVRLTTTKFREGYDQEQVDAFIARAATALDEHRRGIVPSLTADDVENAKFAATKFREGYDQDETDDLLDRVIRTLRS